ncbi:MAG: hypothetical protein R3B68_10670 [Phycisphaerales bacterium]
MLLLAGSMALAACASRTTTGTVLHAGESATIRLTGSPIRFEIANIGQQPLGYTLTVDNVEESQGLVGPGGRVAESRNADEILVTITNPGPGLAHASVETRSRHGMEFRQPPSQATPGS